MNKYALFAVPALLVPLAAFVWAPVAPTGPGAIADMLRGMFKAIDAGDRAGAKACLATAECKFPTLVWDLDLENKPVAIVGVEAAGKYIDSLFDATAKMKATLASKITSLHADCHSPELGFATLEFSQTVTVDNKPETSNYRVTALVSADQDNKWHIFHWHASLVPAAAPPAAPAAGKGK